MKKTKIIIPAMGMLLLGTAASVTGTVAWFSMNNSVAVTGMNVRTTVGSNILISATNAEAEFRSGLNQPVSGILEPVSTVNGVNFYYHATDKNVSGDGHVTDTTFVAYEAGDAFDSNYGFTIADTIECYGYKDYSFYIKATNGANATKSLVMSKCNITYKGSAVSDKAWRVAVFGVSTSAGTTVNDATATAVGNLKSILKLSAAEYFNDQAVSATNAFDSVTSLGAHADIGTISSSTTGYFKIVARLWLEGNDTNCKNDTYASLSGDFQLDLSFQLGDADSGVNALGSVGNAAATGDGTATAAVTLTTGAISNGELAASFQWYNDDGNTVIADATSSSYSNSGAAKSVYCMVTTSRGNVYRTNTVSLIAVA